MALRKHLLDHNPEAMIQTLKEARGPLLKNTKERYPALQIAAREGMLSAALWLLNAGAPVDQAQEETKREGRLLLSEQDKQKSPLYLAAERGHTLLAKALLVFGADKKQALDFAEVVKQPEGSALKVQADTTKTRLTHKLNLTKEDVHIFFFWAVCNYKKEYGFALIDKLLLSLSSLELNKPELHKFIGSMLELAAYHDQVDIVKHLLAGRELAQEHMSTAGYWAVVNNNLEIFSCTCKDEATKTRALKLVRTHRSDIDITPYLSELSQSVQQTVFNDLVPIALPVGLSSNLKIIYKEAVLSRDNKNLKTLSKLLRVNDAFVLLDKLFSEQKYLALQKLFSVLTERHPAIYFIILENRRLHLANFMRMCDGVDMYMLALHAYANTNPVSRVTFLSDKFIVPGEQAGVLQRAVSRSIVFNNDVEPIELKIRHTLGTSGLVQQVGIVNTVLRCLYDVRPAVNLLLLLGKNTPLDQRLDEIDATVTTRSLMTEKLGRFGIDVRTHNNSEESKNKIKRLNRHSLNLIFQYCDEKSLSAVDVVCRQWSDIKRDPTGKAMFTRIREREKQRARLTTMENQYKHLGIILNAINDYLQKEEVYFNTRCDLDHVMSSRNIRINLALVFPMVALFTVVALLAAPVSEARSRVDAVIDQINHGDECTNFIKPIINSYTKCHYLRDGVPEICESLCNMLSEYMDVRNGFQGGLAVAATFGGLFSIALLATLSMCSSFGPSRFDKIPIIDCSPGVLNAATKIFNYNDEAFRGMNQNTLAGALRQTVRNRRDAIVAEQTELKSEIDQLRSTLGYPPYEESNSKEQKITVVVESVAPAMSTPHGLFSNSVSSSKDKKAVPTTYGSLDVDEKDEGTDNISMATPLLGEHKGEDDSSANINLDNLTLSSSSLRR